MEGQFSWRRISTVVTGFVACVLLAGAIPAVGQETPERFTGRIVDAGGAVPRGTSTTFTIHIDEYTTADEVREHAEFLREKGPIALERKLWKLERGWIKIGDSLGYPLAVTRSVATDGGRVVRVLTDRPLQFFEIRAGLRSEEYPFGIIELQLDAEGKGEGRLIAAAKIEFNKDGDLEIESFGIQPFRLMNVKQKEQKKK